MNNHPERICPLHPENKNKESCLFCEICEKPPLSQINELEEPQTLLWRFWLASIIAIPEIFLHLFPLGVEQYVSIDWMPFFEMLLTTLIVWVIGWPIIYKMFRSIFLQKLNRFSLIGAAILTAYFYSLLRMFLPYIEHIEISQESLYDLYFEPSAVITTLVILGLFLEARMIQKTSKILYDLLANVPRFGTVVLPNGGERKIAFDDIKRGDVLKIKPEEKIPIDGIVKEGHAWVNEAIITGESLPVFKRMNNRVLGGSLNGNRILFIIADRTGKEMQLMQMIQISASAYISTSKQNIAEKFSQWLIPAVFLIAILTCIFWWISGFTLSVGISHAVAVLIIACPSALNLAIPLSMIVGMEIALKYGILIKDPSVFTCLAKATTLVVDKTGTLTEGKPLLTHIVAQFPFTEKEVLQLGASVEALSEHPVAQAIVSGAKLQQIALLSSLDFQNINGKGVIAHIDDSRVVVGNTKLLEELKIDPTFLVPQAEKWQKEGLTVVFVAIESRVIGLLAVADPIKFNAERAIQRLHQERLRIVMATGESKLAACAVGKKLHIDEVVADMLPQDKLFFIQKLQKEGHFVAVVGNNADDDPSMAQADVGIAMGGGSSLDLSAHTASITLLKGSLRGVVRSRILCQATMKNIRQNLTLTLIYNLLAIPIAAGVLYPFFGFNLTPIIACVAMTLSSLFIIANSLRLQKIKLFE